MKTALISALAAAALALAPAATADDGTGGGSYAPSRDNNSVSPPSFYHFSPKVGSTEAGAMDSDMAGPGVNDDDAYSPGVLEGSQGTGYGTASWWAKPQTKA